MEVIPRHVIVPVEYIKKDLKLFLKEIPENIGYLQARPAANVGGMLTIFFDPLAKAVAASRPPKEVLRIFLLYKELALANFKFGAGGMPFKSIFEGVEIAFVPEPKTDFMAVDYWADAFDACMIARDMEGLRFLASLSEDIFINSNQGASSFNLAYYRFLSHFFTGGKDTGDLLIAVMKETDKPQENSTRKAFVDLVRYPELLMLQEFILEDVVAFNKALEKAIVSHKKFYGSKQNANAPKGWISLPILSACVMASDAKKFPIEVESDYIPHWMIMGEGLK